MVMLAPLVAVALLAVTGTFGEALPGLPSPGRVTQVGLPATQALRDVAAMVAVGVLVLAVTCVPPADRAGAGRLGGLRRRLVDAAGYAALAWASLNVVAVVFTYSDAAGAPVSAAGFFDEAVFFATEYDLGRYLLAGAVLAVIVSLVTLTCRTPQGAGFAAVVAVAGLWPLALTAHGAGTLRHDLAVDIQFFHLAAVAVWVGGLVGLILVGRSLSRGAQLVSTVRRFSTVAGWCLVVVTVAGLGAAVVRLEDVSELGSDYGRLLLAKSAAAAVLAGLGYAHRRRMLPRLDPARSDEHGHTEAAAAAFRRLVTVEAAVILATIGIAVALNRTPPPPRAQDPLTATEDLLGYSMPGPLDASGWFTSWRVDAFWVPVAAVAVVAYLVWVRRLRRRGDAWPFGRTVAWVFGWLLFTWAIAGAPGAYGRVLFSMHMVQHMTVATAVPVLLVLGAPVTLALRALARRTDGSMGPREWTLAIVRSTWVTLLGRPVVAGVVFVGSLVVFYYSSLFDIALESHTGHVLMTAHFLLAGYLFAGCLVGIDPGLAQPTYPLRVLMVMVVFGFHALFSVSLMASTEVLGEDWYTALERPWGASLADDQYLGASLGWALGDYPLALLAGVLVFMWVRADGRERARFDRGENREGDRQLEAYNAHLRRVADHDRRSQDQSTVSAAAREPGRASESDAVDPDAE